MTVLALVMTPVLHISFTDTASAATSISPLIQELLNRRARRSEERQSNTIVQKPSTTPIAQLPQQSSSASSAVSSVPSSLQEFRNEVIRLVNEERTKQGLSPYTYNATLESSAQDYAAHMESEKCFSHTACGSTLKERMHASGYYQGGGKSYYYGENIARGQKTAQKVMTDWMNSPPHKAAILSSKYKEIGVGKSGTYWVQHFGVIK